MKRRIKAFICAAVLLLTLPSCAGIGDGALIGDIYLNGERIVCTVEAYTFDHELRDSFRMDGAPANELFAYMTGYEYDNRVLGNSMMAQYVTVTFERFNLKGERLSDVDPKSGLKYQYRVFVDDETMQKVSDGEGFQTLGYPDGMYERIVGYFAVRSSSNGYFCSISPGKSPGVNINVPAQAGYKMYKSLTEGEYGNNYPGFNNLVKPGCYIIDFGGASNKCYYIFENDSVCEYELSIDSNNADPMKPLGTLNGIYKQAEELFLLSLENQSNLDTEAGMKLNCIQVNTKPGEYSADDFADIGCIYLDKRDENSYIVYFPRKIKYEFDQCLELLKAREDLIEVSPIFIIEMH